MKDGAKNMIEKNLLAKYLHVASKMLLLAFVLSIIVVGVIYYNNTADFNYEVLPQGEDPMFYIQETNNTLISYEDYLVKKHKFNKIIWITTICLVGWMACNDVFRKNMREAWREWNDKINRKD